MPAFLQRAVGGFQQGCTDSVGIWGTLRTVKCKSDICSTWCYVYAKEVHSPRCLLLGVSCRILPAEEKASNRWSRTGKEKAGPLTFDLPTSTVLQNGDYLAHLIKPHFYISTIDEVFLTSFGLAAIHPNFE